MADIAQVAVATTADASLGVECAAYVKMWSTWQLIEDLRGGTRAMRLAGRRWLPTEEQEKPQKYDTRLNRTFLYAGYDDTVRKLTARPFSQPVKLIEPDALDDQLVEIEDDADNANLSLTRFAAKVFEDALDHGLSHIIVDYPALGGEQSLAVEHETGAHPYFIHVPAKDLIGWQSDVDEVSGREVLTQIRIRECRTENDGKYGQVDVEYIRVWTPNDWQLWKQTKDGTYTLDSSGVNSLGRVPLLTVYFKRTGFMVAEPPLEGLAWLNLEHWQSSSEQRHGLRFGRVPAMYEQGVPKDQISTPIVLGAGLIHRTSASPAESNLSYVAAPVEALKIGADDLATIEARMQILGLQPLVDQVAPRTATEVQSGEVRTHSSILEWIGSTNDLFFDAYTLAADWIKSELPEGFSVSIYKAFDLPARAATDVQTLVTLNAAGKITDRTLLVEVQRRGLFSETFDIDKELEETAAAAPMPTAPTPEEQAAMDKLKAQRAARSGAPSEGAAVPPAEQAAIDARMVSRTAAVLTKAA